MPLFRFHKGGLEESLKTTVIVKNREELKIAIIANFAGWEESYKNRVDFEIWISALASDINDCFDARIGWYSHYVTADFGEKGAFRMVGILSEPLDE